METNNVLKERRRYMQEEVLYEKIDHYFTSRLEPIASLLVVCPS